MIPNCCCNIQSHILADTMVGIAHGTKTAVRTKPRPLNSALSTNATAKPKIVSNVTETIAKKKVFLIAPHQAELMISEPVKNKPYSPM